MGTCQGSKTSETGTGNIKTAQRISPGLQRHFDIENAKVEKFMSGQASSKSGGSLTMDNGQILERYTLKEMQGILKETKDNGYVWSDDGFSILYNDGSMSFYAPGDDISKVRTSGIKGVIYENGSTTAYAGSGVKKAQGIEIFVTAVISPLLLEFTTDFNPADNNVTLDGYSVKVEQPKELTFWEKIVDFFKTLVAYLARIFGF